MPSLDFTRKQNLDTKTYLSMLKGVGYESKLTCDTRDRHLYLSRAYLTKASFSPGFIVHLEGMLMSPSE